MVAVASPVAAVSGAPSDEERRVALRRMKVLATSLLVVAAVIFVVARQFEPNPVAGYVEAFAEAAMVGALADWFAVTALFRHPLGLPIPHTAIIAERKDDIGRGLGTFVQGNFLSGPVIAEKVRSLGVADRVAQHLRDREQATKLAANAGDAVTAVMEVLRDEDVAPVVQQAAPAQPAVGRALAGRAVQQFVFHLVRRRQPVDEGLVNVDMAGRARAAAAALGVDAADVVLDGGLHHAGAELGLDAARAAVLEDVVDRGHLC